MKYHHVILALALAAIFIPMAMGGALAQEDCTEDDCEDCTSCRTNNFYYILIAAIVIFAVFFYWTNRHKMVKPPVEPEKPDEEKK